VTIAGVAEALLLSLAGNPVREHKATVLTLSWSVDDTALAAD
jgi:hypothetical protein